MKNEEIQLSIVVAAWNGNASLARCLDSLEKQSDSTNREIIVVSNFVPELKAVDSSISVHLRPATYTVPELRRDGISAARGNVIAVIEDHCHADSEWCREIKKAHAAGETVAGGAVDNAATAKRLDWAVYFYDYGKYMPPNRAGAADALSGLNVSYRRAALEEISGVYKDGFFETFANEALKARGHRLWLAPSAVVFHNKSYELKPALAHCYHLARSFASRRAAAAGAGRRLLFIAGSLVLPAVLPTRVAVSIIKKGRNLKPFAASMPLLIVLLSVWSFGEFCGYTVGEGKSGQAWR